MKLTYIIATRSRPDDLVETVFKTMPHVGRTDTKVLICADADDSTAYDIRNRLPKDPRIIFSLKEREDSRGEKYDRALTEAPADVYLVGHDCSPIITPGFDQIVINAARLFPDGIGVVNSPMFCGSFPSAQAITAKLVEKIGYIYSHEYPYWFIDHELDDIARMIGRYVHVDIDIDRVPRRPQKTLRMWEIGFWASYFDAAMLYRRNIARKIIDSPDFEEPEWRKMIMRSWYHVVEARSFTINEHCRINAAEWERIRGEQGPPDDGYVRIRARAQKIITERFHEMEALAAAA